MGSMVRTVNSMSMDLVPHFIWHEVNSSIRSNALWNTKMVNRMTCFVATNPPLSPGICHCPRGSWMMWSQWQHRLPPSRSTWLWPLQSAQLPAAENSMAPFLRVISQLPVGRLITLNYLHHGRGAFCSSWKWMCLPCMLWLHWNYHHGLLCQGELSLCSILWRKSSYNSLNQYFWDQKSSTLSNTVVSINLL